MPRRAVADRRPRPCSEWSPAECVLTVGNTGKSPWCVFTRRCMYATDRSELAPQLLELWDAWCNGRLCMLWYAPGRASDDAS